jgi:hypothetical protein
MDIPSRKREGLGVGQYLLVTGPDPSASGRGEIPVAEMTRDLSKSLKKKLTFFVERWAWLIPVNTC